MADDQGPDDKAMQHHSSMNGAAIASDKPNTTNSTSSNDEPQSSPPSTDNEPTDSTLQQLQMELNVALESLETMRRANLEVEFSCSKSAVKVDHERCTYCQREEMSQPPVVQAASVPQDVDDNEAAGFGSRLRDLKLDGHRIRSLDGSRIRNFSKRFLSKCEAIDAKNNAGNKITGEVNGDDSSAAEGGGSTVGALKKSELNYGSNSAEGADSAVKAINCNHDTKSKLHMAESCPARLENRQDSASSSITEATTSSVNETKSRRNLLKRIPNSCLTCGHPTCKLHISKSFSTHHIHICQPCAHLFELDFLVDVIAHATDDAEKDGFTNNNIQQCQQKVNEMIDCYDRAKLLLTYTSQFAPEISSGLQSRTAASNAIGVGANASGIVSGITGIVGASALLFPPAAAAGVPILIASLVFGGGATAVHTGDYAAVKYWSEPTKLADKMVVLHGMCLSLLRVVEVLSFGLLRKEELDVSKKLDGERNLEGQYGEGMEKRQALTRDIETLLEKHGVNHSIGKQAIQSSTKISGSNVACRHSRFFGRVGTTAAASFRFVPLVGGILSAASLAVEANEIKKTLARMNEGNPCEKADQIMEIAEEVERLPDATLIAGECARVFEEAKKEKESKREKGLLTTLSDDAFDKAVEGQMAAALADMNAALPSSPQNRQMKAKNETRLSTLDNDEFEKAVEKEMVAAHVDRGSGETALKKLQPPVIDNAVEEDLAQVDSMETDIGVGI